jgi:hypothetical protein
MKMASQQIRPVKGSFAVLEGARICRFLMA